MEEERGRTREYIFKGQCHEIFDIKSSGPLIIFFLQKFAKIFTALGEHGKHV
jgi:hypothetical protein